MDKFTDTLDLRLEAERLLQEVWDFLEKYGRQDAAFSGDAQRIKQHIYQDLRYLKMVTNNVTTIGSSANFGGPNPLLMGGPKAIMGKPVGDQQPITAKTLKPTKNATDKFKATVKDLYAGVRGMSDQDMLNLLGKPGGETLIRGVAKLAGVPNWDSAESTEINYGFFEAIRLAVEEKETGAMMNESLDAELSADDTTAEEETEEEEVVVAPKKSAAKKPVVAPKKSAAKKSILDDEEDDE